MKELRGKVAVVTGGGSGIGAALARACAAEGMAVVAADVDFAAAERVAAEIRSGGGCSLAAAVDVRERASLGALVRTYAELGACHLLCNNAAACALDAVRADVPYAITHPDWWPFVEARFEGLRAAFDTARAAAAAGAARPDRPS